MSEIINHQITFQVGKEVLAGQITAKKDLEKPPGVLFLHGAGKSSQKRTRYLSLALAKRDIFSFSFDFSGHGESSGSIDRSSLKKRLEEALAAIRFLSDEEALVVCGSSMGAHIALKLLDQVKIKSMILFAPAIYDRAAFDIKFGRDFSETIRKPESWQRTDVLQPLREFSGKLLICIGEKDDVIPPGVIDILNKNSSKARKKDLIVVAKAPHRLHPWLAKHRSEADQIIEKVIEYCE